MRRRNKSVLMRSLSFWDNVANNTIKNHRADISSASMMGYLVMGNIFYQIVVRRSNVRGVMGTPKNGKTRYIPLSKDAYTVLEERKSESGLVFCREDGRPLSYSIAYHAIDRACNTANIRHIGWHTLRHTFASRLVSEGVPLNVVQELMGHSTITMTMKYAHLAPSELHSAVNILEASEKRAIEKMST